MANNVNLLLSLLFTLQRNGWALRRVWDGQERIPLQHLSPTKARAEAVASITAVEAATISVINEDKETSFIFIINSLDSDELAADYGCGVADIVEAWQDAHS